MRYTHADIKKFLLITLVSLSFNSSAESLNTEKIFANASLYTLELYIEISTPFVEDEKGSFMGTGFLIDEELGWVLTNAHVSSRSDSVIKVGFSIMNTNH